MRKSALVRRLVLALTLIGAWASPVYASNCQTWLTSGPFSIFFEPPNPVQLQRSAHLNGPLAQYFFDDSTLFFNDFGVHPEAVSFLASNERDFHRTPWDTADTDVLVGFGTNSAWDIAARKNAKFLVIGDYSAGPLLVQRYVLRPLLRIARTPAEFLMWLTGFDLPAEHLNDSLFRLQEYLRLHLMDLVRDSEGQSRQLIKKLEAAGLSDLELDAISAHFRTMAGGRIRDTFGLVRGYNAHETGNLFYFFAQRYLPGHNFNLGAQPELVADPKFTFLSSQENFDRFKALYADSRYAHTDYMSENFYLKLKEEADKRGYRKLTFSVTNIMDANNKTKSAAMAEFERFRQLVYRIFPADHYEVLIFATTNYMEPHGFLRVTREQIIQSNEWIRALP